MLIHVGTGSANVPIMAYTTVPVPDIILTLMLPGAGTVT